MKETKTTKTRGRPKKVLMTDAHRDSLMAGINLIVKSMQESEKRGYTTGYGDGLVRGYEEGHKYGCIVGEAIAKDNTEQYDDGLIAGYLAGHKAAYKLMRYNKEDEDFNFWTTFLSTIVIGSVLIGIWWILSGQL